MAQASLDIKVRTAGEGRIAELDRALDGLEKKYERLKGQAPVVSSGTRKLGASAKAASGGFKALGASINAALGPLGAILSGVAGLQAAFAALSGQDFSNAKVESLGVNAKDLNVELKALSRELQGQASVADLTAAAYDVASAGFNNAADAAQVLKAASLGATGGFSDINTVGNAATSVLNAYGLAASEAGAVVDKFIQTQNDGKIVVAEYAANVGKVASAAAGLKVPLSEVNAVIAQSTASGVKAESAFTGLTGALARFASGDATKALEGTGIEIDAASVAADGLLGTLKKLEGLDTGQIFKALGTEAGPALLPIINNLERFEELIQNQEKSAGAAAKAQALAADTIQGAWNRVSTAFSNLFSDQAELGILIKSVLKVAAVTVEALAAAFNLLLTPTKAVAAALQSFGKALAQALGLSVDLQDLEKGWQAILGAVEKVSSVIVAFGATFGELLGNLARIALEFGADLLAAFEGPISVITGLWGQFTSFVAQDWAATASEVQGVAADLWNKISNGVRGIVGSIGNAFRDAFAAAFAQIRAFYDQLPAWLKGALSGAASVAGAVTGAVGKALGKVGGALQEAGSSLGRAFNAPATGGRANQAAAGAVSVPVGASGGSGGGGGGGGKGGADQAAEEAKRTAERIAGLQQDVALNEKLFGIKQKIAAAQLADNEELVIRLQGEEERLKLTDRYARQIDKATDAGEKAALLAKRESEGKLQQLQVENRLAQLAQAKQKAAADAVKGVQDEIDLLNAKLQGKEKEYRLEKQIAELKQGGVPEAQARALVTQRDQLEGQVAAVDKQKQLWADVYGIVSGELQNGIKGLIDGTAEWGDILSSILDQLASLFLNAAFSGIGKGLKLPGFAEGGFISNPTVASFAENEPEYAIPESRMDDAMARWSAGARGDSVIDGPTPGGGSGDAMEPEQVTQISISGGVTQMGGNEFIRKDQIGSIVAQASKAGEARTLRKLQMSAAARRKAGLA